MKEPGLEFVWVGDDAIDPLQQAGTLNILSAPASRHQDTRRGAGGTGARGGRKAGAKAAECSAIPGVRTKVDHFLDRLRRSWHNQLQWENGASGDKAAASRSVWPDIRLPPRSCPPPA